MFEFVAFLTLFNNVEEATLPQPTKAQIKLISEMGSEKFKVRENAEKNLTELGRDALVSLEKIGLNHEDLEVRYRSKRIVKKFYNVSTAAGRIPKITGLCKSPDIPLPSGKIFKYKKNTAQKYYMAVGGNHTIGWEMAEELLYESTSLFSKRLLRSGYSKEDVIAIMEHIEKREFKYVWYQMLNDEAAIEEINPR